MIELVKHREGVILPIRAQPGARKNAIVGAHGGALKVAVTAPPEKGKANKAIIDLLARALGLSKAQLELIAGETSSRKKLLVRGLSIAELAAKIGSLV
jgi:uncharacterized protein (TIGR00251 family)